MKTKFAIAALSLASVISFGASAASLVSNEEAQHGNLQSMNQTISVSGNDGDQTNIRQALSAKADAQGAGHYRIIESHFDDAYHVTAELYK
ncbi:YdgH/BhsA/McbA-like domain containing protein [Pantoea sp.]|uniref:YdgH/BhsA/McbA-like domain containing protein n=1 Tax=Pantoea sp. TaxID=69393 RepID=UPI002896BF56|nr:YdgH/BhsA/McbA-like domain containing protein [Pantoea sp.]